MSLQTPVTTHLDIESDRESLRLHAVQASGSRVAIWVVFSLAMMALYPSMPAWRILGWGLPMLAVAQIIHLQCQYILARIDHADAASLRHLHTRMRWTTVAHQGLMGTTVWWFGWQHDFELALVGTALHLIYVGAAMANGAVNVKTFIIGARINLLAGMAYWFLLESHRWPVGLALLGALFVMTRLSQNMANGFRESLRMRFENNELVARLAEEKRVAVEATQFKSRFLANVSHEIRTPVSSIVGMCYLALKTELTAKQRQYLQIVLHSSEHLNALLNQVLDFSKVEARMLVLDRHVFSLRQVLEQVHAQHATLAQSKLLTLTSTADANVPNLLEGDAMRLREILTNFVSNAIKFTPAGDITVHVQLLESAGTHASLKFTVTDTGIGLQADQLSRIFESFQQADTSITRQYGGTGLGLAIAKNLAEMMNGSVGATSSPGQGSSFWFTARFELPNNDHHTPGDIPVALHLTASPAIQPTPLAMPVQVAEREEALPHLTELARLVANSDPQALACLDEHAGLLGLLMGQAEATISAAIRDFNWPQAEKLLAELGCQALPGTTQPTHHAFTVLAVDDNPVNLALMVELLSPHHGVRVAASGERALHIASSQQIDLVLLDVMMPVMDGYEVCRRLQALPGMLDCPILFLTARNQIEDTEHGLQLGAQDYLSKPISPPLVLKRIETHLTLRSLKKQLMHC